jgi:hypothetical protein
MSVSPHSGRARTNQRSFIVATKLAQDIGHIDGSSSRDHTN